MNVAGTSDVLETTDSSKAFAACLGVALRYLGYRPRTVQEVRRRLEGKFPAPTVERTIAYLSDLNYLDDAAFCAQWISSRERRRPKGSYSLRQELLRLGVDRGLIEEALEGLDEATNAYNAGQKPAARLVAKGHSQQEFRNKLVGHLQRRGFRYGTAVQAANILWEEAGGEGEA